MNSILVDQRFEVTSERNLNCIMVTVFSVFKKSLAVCFGLAALAVAVFVVCAILSAGLMIVIGAMLFIVFILLSIGAVKLWAGRE